MAERGIDQKEEKKSYGSAFVIGAVYWWRCPYGHSWMTILRRRRGKGFQSQFYRLDYNKAKAAYEEEDKKLQADAKYKSCRKSWRRFKSSLASGDTGKKLKALERRRSAGDGQVSGDRSKGQVHQERAGRGLVRTRSRGAAKAKSKTLPGVIADWTRKRQTRTELEPLAPGGTSSKKRSRRSNPAPKRSRPSSAS